MSNVPGVHFSNISVEFTPEPSTSWMNSDNGHGATKPNQEVLAAKAGPAPTKKRKGHSQPRLLLPRYASPQIPNPQYTALCSKMWYSPSPHRPDNKKGNLRCRGLTHACRVADNAERAVLKLQQHRIASIKAKWPTRNRL